MITVTVVSKQDSVVEIEVLGHAGFAKNGHDIVCAACSVLILNTMNSIERFTDENIVMSAEENGYIKVYFPDRKDGNIRSDVTLLLNAMLLGLSDMEYEYKKHIKIIRRCQND